MPLVITKSMLKFIKANEEVKYLVMSPLAKRTKLSKKNVALVKNRKECKNLLDQNVILSVLAKPSDGCVNGKNRSRFPDPCQDRSILLAVLDPDQNFLRLNYLTSDGELQLDESSEKVASSSLSQYFILLEKIERKYSTDHRTEVYAYPSNGHLENFMYANLQDHTIVDKCLPDGVAGYWIRTFGEPSVFILTIALWKWNGTSGKSRQNLNTCSDCLRRLSDVKVEFSNIQRTKTSGKSSTIPEVIKPPLDASELLKESANIGIVKTLRTFRDNGMLKEFSFACKSFLRTSEEHKNKDSCVIVMLEQSLFHSHQGNSSQAKKVLQNAVELSGKAKYSNYLLNRAYLYLATVHVNGGTTGTAEEILSVVKKDSKLVLPPEDMGWYYILKGIVYLKFSEKIEGFAEKLWVEAKNMFTLAILELEKVDTARSLSIDAHFWFAKLYLVISKAKTEKQPVANTAIIFQNVDELLNLAAEHLSIGQTMDQSDFSERLQLKYNILQAEYYLACFSREEHTAVIEEGYWSGDTLEKIKTNPFSDSNQEEEDVTCTEVLSVTPTVTINIDSDSKSDNAAVEEQKDNSSLHAQKDNKGSFEQFGLVISSRKSSPVFTQDDETSADDSKYTGLDHKKDVVWPLMSKGEDHKETCTHNYLMSARDCLQKTVPSFQNPLFSVEKKDYERVLSVLEKMEKNEQFLVSKEINRQKKPSLSKCDSGYEADCSSLDGTMYGSVYQQTTYV